MKGSMSVVVREARLGDAAALMELLTELGFPSSEAEVTQRLESLMRSGEIVLVAAVGDVPVGLVAVHITPVLHRPTPVGRMTALVVGGSMRGKGVGRALVTAAEEACVVRGCALMEVTSNLRLPEAHRFYEQLGYEFTSKRFKRILAS